MPTYEIARDEKGMYPYTVYRMNEPDGQRPYAKVVAVTQTLRGARFKAWRDARKPRTEDEQVTVRRFEA